MAKQRLRANVPLHYPVGKSLEIVREAGGISKLTEAQRKKVRIKSVEPGGYCDDMPEESRAPYLESGKVEWVEPPADKKKGGK